MNLKTFITERNLIVDEVLNKTDIYLDEKLNRTFNFVSANVLHFLPEISVGNHESIFKNIVLNQRLSILDQTNPNISKMITTEGLDNTILNTLKNKPCIIATFHMGSNRLLPHFLAKHKISYSIVIANHIANKEGEELSKMFIDVYKNTGCNFNIIFAQKGNAALKMLKDLRQGRSLIVFMDGNTGAGDDSIYNENRCLINFFNKFIYARKGIGYISHMANVPVIPAFSYKKFIDDIRIKFFPAIYPDTTIERNHYAHSLTQKIYDLFTPILRKYPQQWECWIYLHTITNTKLLGGQDLCNKNNNTLQTNSFKLNIEKYGLFNIKNEYYLFHKPTYESYLISEDIYRLLETSLKQTIEKNSMDFNLFQQLHLNNALTYY